MSCGRAVYNGEDAVEEGVGAVGDGVTVVAEEDAAAETVPAAAHARVSVEDDARGYPVDAQEAQGPGVGAVKAQERIQLAEFSSLRRRLLIVVVVVVFVDADGGEGERG